MKDYKQLFLDRWKELEHEIHLDKDEDGEIISTSFLKKNVFYKFFTSPELLVRYYIWRGNGLAKDGGDAEYYFDLEYDGWNDDCDLLRYWISELPSSLKNANINNKVSIFVLYFL